MAKTWGGRRTRTQLAVSCIRNDTRGDGSDADLGARQRADALTSPFNPFAASYPARATAAACEMFVNATRRYGKPEFGIDETEIAGRARAGRRGGRARRAPFCNLLHFRRACAVAAARNDPKLS